MMCNACIGNWFIKQFYPGGVYTWNDFMFSPIATFNSAVKSLFPVLLKFSQIVSVPFHPFRDIKNSIPFQNDQSSAICQIIIVPLCVLCLLNGLRNCTVEIYVGRYMWRYIFFRCFSLSNSVPSFLGLPFSSYTGAKEEKYEKSQMFTPAFQGWLSYLGYKYEFLKRSTQVSILGISYSLLLLWWSSCSYQ